MPDTDLIIEEISLKYQEGEQITQICQDVSFTAKPGEIIGVLGPNGSGKSTILKALLGLKKLDRGKITLPADPVMDNQVAYIPQNFQSSFFKWASLKNNILMTMPHSYKSWKLNTRLINRTKDELGIAVDLALKPNACSGGMLQQAAIVRGFVASAKLLVADEPFSALDVEIAGKIRKVFREKIKARNIIGILVLHNMDDLSSVCDKILVIPNKPYSTDQISDHHQVRFFSNSLKNKMSDENKGNSLLKISESIFGPHH